jgi:hypothetical protein
MSYEGYCQLWCVCGCEWTVDEDYDVDPDPEDDLCPDCGDLFVQSNRVDDTNCDSYGFFLRRDVTRAPTDEEISAVREKGSYLSLPLSRTDLYFVGGVLTAYKPAPGQSWVFI